MRDRTPAVSRFIAASANRVSGPAGAVTAINDATSNAGIIITRAPNVVYLLRCQFYDERRSI
jgi:hypothetical protein